VRMGNWMSHTRVIVVRVKCETCEAERGFEFRLWSDTKITLGCYRCHERHGDDFRAKRMAFREEDLERQLGHWILQSTRRSEMATLYIRAACTGPICGGTIRELPASNWVSKRCSKTCTTCSGSVNKALSEQKRQSILRAIEAGTLQRLIAAANGVSITTVNRLSMSRPHTRAMRQDAAE
jgi:hypothetical protein